MSIDDNYWELYDDHPAFSTAAASLTQGWEVAKRLVPEAPSSERAQAAERYMYHILVKFQDVGALDTEPRAVVRGLVKKHFGVIGGYL